MHDQRKIREEMDEKTRLFQEEKIQRFRSVYDRIFDHYRRGDLSRDVLELLNVLLEISPEQYTFFGYRRRILLSSWAADEEGGDRVDVEHNGDEGSSSGPEGQPPTSRKADGLKTEDLEKEYALNTAVVMKDFKVYSAFVHRRWIFSEMRTERRQELLLSELKKCEALLKMDDRNFHAWGYRRWVTGQVRLHGVVPPSTPDREEETCASAGRVALYSDSDEWTFTEAKINQNFSNYSAWHNRALLLESASLDTVGDFALRELDLVIKAFYCDPNDQSAWLYAEYVLRLLQQHSSLPGGSAAAAAYVQVLESIIHCCGELSAECAQEREEQMTTTSGAYVMWMQLTLAVHHTRGGVDRLPEAVASAVAAWGTPAELMGQLIAVDPLREGMYRSMISS